MMKPYLCVKASDGEKTRQALITQALLDTDFRIIAEKGQLFFPLNASTSHEKLSSLLKHTNFERGEREFHVIKGGPKSLEEALEDSLTSEEIKLLPRAYDLIGDIAVLEIPDELYTFRYAIGNAFQEIHKNFDTVLAKSGAVKGLTRVREYEYLAGTKKTHTVHTEYGCRIAVDLSVAYFSPRLLEEHHRIASQVEPSEIVVDLFTGVGPFALHIARNVDAQIFAVDINSEAIQLLQQSMELNRLVGSIKPIVMDAHKFSEFYPDLVADRVIMNHPSGAHTFIKDACSIVGSNGIIHYYDFVGGNNLEETFVTHIEKLIAPTSREIDYIEKIRRVRDSAPYEYQMVADIIMK